MSGRSLRTAGLAVVAACAMVGGPIAAHETAGAHPGPAAGVGRALGAVRAPLASDASAISPVPGIALAARHRPD